MGGELSKKILFPVAALSFLLLVMLPLAYTFVETFVVDRTISFQHYRNIFSPGNLYLFFWSALSAAVIATICTAAGGAMGFLLSRTNMPFSGPIKLLLLVPLLVSPYYFAVAWRDFFNSIGFVELMQGNLSAVSFVLTLCYIPLSMLVFSSAFANINNRMEEAGMMVAGRLQVFRSITLPLVKSAIFSSFVLVFILSISEMSVASYYIVKSYTSEIFVRFSAFYNHEEAIAMSSLLLIVCFGMLRLERSYLLSAPFLSVGNKGNPLKKVNLGRWRIPVFSFFSIYLLLTMLIPIIMLTVQSLEKAIPPPLREGNVPKWKLMESPEGMEQKGYYLKEALGILQPVIRDSLMYALLGAILLCILGFLLAYYNIRQKRTGMDFVLLFAFAVPSTVLGIGLIKFYNRPSLEFIYGSFAIVLVGYVGKFAFIASKVIGHSVRQIPYTLEETALLSGAGFMKRLRSIVFPLISDGFFVAFILCFVFCLGEIATSIVVYPPGTSLLPIKIATSMHNTPDGLISSMVLIAIITTLIALGILFLLRRYLLRKMNYAGNQF